MSSDADDAETKSDPSDANGGYVHTPDGLDGAAPSKSESKSGSSESATAAEQPPSETDEFGLAGWALTVMLIVSMLVIPGIIYLYPYFLGSMGLSFFGTYLVLPLIPAGVLGLVAVWSMTAAVHEE